MARKTIFVSDLTGKTIDEKLSWLHDHGELHVIPHKLPITRQAYSEAYYRDFYVHGVTNRGPDFVTMTRGWDKSYGFEGRFYARPEHAPHATTRAHRIDRE